MYNEFMDCTNTKGVSMIVTHQKLILISSHLFSLRNAHGVLCQLSVLNPQLQRIVHSFSHTPSLDWVSSVVAFALGLQTALQATRVGAAILPDPCHRRGKMPMRPRIDSLFFCSAATPVPNIRVLTGCERLAGVVGFD